MAAGQSEAVPYPLPLAAIVAITTPEAVEARVELVSRMAQTGQQAAAAAVLAEPLLPAAMEAKAATEPI